jgi:intein-encoded DNA endonuclease-like protein
MSKELEPQEIIKWCKNLHDKFECGYVTKFD